jgi:pectate lyase
MKALLLIAAVLIFSAGRAFCKSNPDADRYVNAVREFADNVLERGRDTYGPKQTPLFVDGLNVDTLQPPIWKKNGEEWILSNMASQQNLFRTLDGLTSLTGERKYRGAAVRATRYAFDNLRGPNGLLYWGGHYCYDAAGDKLVGESESHELKRHYPYHELMWQVDPAVTKKYIEAVWRTHIIDWDNLDMNRHGKYDKDTDTPWPEKYVGGPIFFTSKANGLSFINTGSDIYYAGAMLHKLSGEEAPLVWAKRMAGRYAETANPQTGMRGFQYSRVTQDRAEAQFSEVERLKGHLVLEGTILPPAYGRMVHATAGIVQMKLSEMLGDEGSEFRNWALDGLRAYGKYTYNPADNTFLAMLTDGTVLSRADIQKDGYYGKVGESEMLDPLESDPAFFWAYAMAYRLSGERFMWDMARNVGRGEGLGDIGETSKGAAKLDMSASCSDPMYLMGCLELYRCTGRSEFLDMAKKIGDNILEQRFYKGFFLPSKDYINAKFDTLEPLVLLTLAAEIRGEPSAVPEVWPSRSYFHCPFDGVGRTYDRDIIYLQKRE